AGAPLTVAGHDLSGRLERAAARVADLTAGGRIEAACDPRAHDLAGLVLSLTPRQLGAALGAVQPLLVGLCETAVERVAALLAAPTQPDEALLDTLLDAIAGRGPPVSSVGVLRMQQRLFAALPGPQMIERCLLEISAPGDAPFAAS